MLQPAELERLLLTDADCLHGRQPIEGISNASIGCDIASPARTVPEWESFRATYVNLLEAVSVSQSYTDATRHGLPAIIPLCSPCAAHVARDRLHSKSSEEHHVANAHAA